MSLKSCGLLSRLIAEMTGMRPFTYIKQALRHGATLEIIMTALEAAKSSIAWTKDGGQYIPGISKWLQREPWREANLQKAQKENQEQWNSQ